MNRKQHIKMTNLKRHIINLKFLMVIGRITYECTLIQKLNELTKKNIALLCENKYLPLN